MADVNHPINSTAIESCSSNAEEQTLTVIFYSGVSVTYLDVGQDTVQELLNAPSVGRFYNQNIRGQFQEA